MGCLLGIQPCIAGVPTLPPVTARILAITVPFLKPWNFIPWTLTERCCQLRAGIPPASSKGDLSHRHNRGV